MLWCLIRRGGLNGEQCATDVLFGDVPTLLKSCFNMSLKL